MISIIMPLLSYSVNVLESIQSIVMQSYVKWELVLGISNKIIMDDKIKKIIEYVHNVNDMMNMNIREEKIQIMVLNCNTRSDALNILYNHTNFDWVALKDIDDIWLFDKLEQQMYIASGGNYHVIGTQIRYKEDKHYIKSIPTRDITDFDFYSKNPIHSCSVIIHKSLQPIWDEDWSPFEDYNIWLKSKTPNIKFYNLHGFYVIRLENRKIQELLSEEKLNSDMLVYLLEYHKLHQKRSRISNSHPIKVTSKK